MFSGPDSGQPLKVSPVGLAGLLTETFRSQFKQGGSRQLNTALSFR